MLRLLRTVLAWYLQLSGDYLVFLGSHTQQTSMFSSIHGLQLWWTKATPREKLTSLLVRRWTPPQGVVEEAAREVFHRDVFGRQDDYGDHLLPLVAWHNSQEWDLSGLTDTDSAKAHALESMTVLTRQRFGEVESTPPLNLSLARRVPLMCLLVQPLVAKTPVISIRYYLDVHSTFAFASIRRAAHPEADGLIAYLYEALFLQQKIAIALHDYLRHSAHAGAAKAKASLMNAEVDAMMCADAIFAYLRASIEKTMALLGLVHGIRGLDGKKTHRARLRALKAGLPSHVLDQGYCQFVLQYMSGENLDELNAFRSGILHKRGIADLQPHNYVGLDAKALPFKRIYEVLHEQHVKNSAMLLGALAVLTDELVRLDPPPFSVSDIPLVLSRAHAQRMFSVVTMDEKEEGSV